MWSKGRETLPNRIKTARNQTQRWVGWSLNSASSSQKYISISDTLKKKKKCFRGWAPTFHPRLGCCRSAELCALCWRLFQHGPATRCRPAGWSPDTPPGCEWSRWGGTGSWTSSRSWCRWMAGQRRCRRYCKHLMEVLFFFSFIVYSNFGFTLNSSEMIDWFQNDLGFCVTSCKSFSCFRNFLLTFLSFCCLEWIPSTENLKK